MLLHALLVTFVVIVVVIVVVLSIAVHDDAFIAVALSRSVNRYAAVANNSKRFVVFSRCNFLVLFIIVLSCFLS